MYKSLTVLKKLEPLQSLKQVKRNRPQRLETPLSEIDLLLYSSNICYAAMQIVRGEIKVKNEDIKLQIMKQEISRLSMMFDRDNYYFHSDYTKQSVKRFFKEVGITPEHLEH